MHDKILIPRDLLDELVDDLIDAECTVSPVARRAQLILGAPEGAVMLGFYDRQAPVSAEAYAIVLERERASHAETLALVEENERLRQRCADLSAMVQELEHSARMAAA